MQEGQDETLSDPNMTGSDESLEIVPPPSPASADPTILPSGSYRKKRAQPKSSEKETIMDNAMKILGTPADSHQIFGDYVADQLRYMTEPKQKKLKLLIQKAIIAVEEQSPTPFSLPSTSSSAQVSPEVIIDEHSEIVEEYEYSLGF